MRRLKLANTLASGVSQSQHLRPVRHVAWVSRVIDRSCPDHSNITSPASLVRGLHHGHLPSFIYKPCPPSPKGSMLPIRVSCHASSADLRPNTELSSHQLMNTCIIRLQYRRNTRLSGRWQVSLSRARTSYTRRRGAVADHVSGHSPMVGGQLTILTIRNQPLSEACRCLIARRVYAYSEIRIT